MKLQEERVIKDIKDKWWIKNNIPIIDGVEKNCTKEEEKSDTLYMAQVYGSFVVLAIGISISFLVGISEFLWNVRKISIAQKVQ